MDECLFVALSDQQSIETLHSSVSGAGRTILGLGTCVTVRDHKRRGIWIALKVKDSPE